MPFQSVEVLTFVIGISFVIQGVMTFIGRLRLPVRSELGDPQRAARDRRRIVVLVYPISSAVTLALIGGIWLIIVGIMQIIAGFQLRSARNKLSAVPSAA